MNARHLLLLLPLVFLLGACEDDPILTPQVGTAAGGSYSSIAPPASPRDSTGVRLQHRELRNPKLY